MFGKKETATNGSSRYQFGKLTGNSYKSEFLEYKCKAPKGGLFSPEDDLLRMSNINPALRETDPAAFREAYYSGKGILDMYLLLPSGTAMMVYWQYYPANLHGGMNVAWAVAERQIGINRNNDGITDGMPQVTEIMGRRFVGITTQYQGSQGDIRCVKEYFHECINGMILVVISAPTYTISDGESLLSMLKKI